MRNKKYFELHKNKKTSKLWDSDKSSTKEKISNQLS